MGGTWSSLYELGFVYSYVSVRLFLPDFVGGKDIPPSPFGAFFCYFISLFVNIVAISKQPISFLCCFC